MIKVQTKFKSLHVEVDQKINKIEKQNKTSVYILKWGGGFETEIWKHTL